jgi:pimeloyl-ACP methyl ester carboxylesterase
MPAEAVIVVPDVIRTAPLGGAVLLKLVHALMRLRLWLGGFRSRRVTTSQGPMHVSEYVGEGELPPLVIVHGICAEGADFVDAVLALRGEFSSIILPDLPGHGQSSDPPDGLLPATLTETTLELFDEVVPKGGLLLGNSLGGVATLRYCLARPGRVRALYLSSPAGAKVSPEAFESFRAQLRLSTWRDGVTFVSKIYRKPPPHRWLIGGAIRDLFARSVLAGFVNALNHDDLIGPEELGALTTPTQVVWGTEDRLLPAEQLDFYKAHMPAGTPVHEPRWGHCPYLDTPRAFAASVLAWARAA